jgi:hypothetical protein
MAKPTEEILRGLKLGLGKLTPGDADDMREAELIDAACAWVESELARITPARARARRRSRSRSRRPGPA